MFRYWKLGVHLVLRTKRFGVNNRWWSDFDSMWGWPWWWIVLAVVTVRPIVDNYRGVKLRAGTMAHMLTDEEYNVVFGEPKGVK